MQQTAECMHFWLDNCCTVTEKEKRNRNTISTCNLRCCKLKDEHCRPQYCINEVQHHSLVFFPLWPEHKNMAQAHRGIRNLLDGLIRADSEDNFCVRGYCHSTVTARLEHTLRFSLAILEIPFIYRSIWATADQFIIIYAPDNRAHLRTENDTMQSF